MNALNACIILAITLLSGVAAAQTTDMSARETYQAMKDCHCRINCNNDELNEYKHELYGGPKGHKIKWKNGNIHWIDWSTVIVHDTYKYYDEVKKYFSISQSKASHVQIGVEIDGGGWRGGTIMMCPITPDVKKVVCRTSNPNAAAESRHRGFCE